MGNSAQHLSQGLQEPDPSLLKGPEPILHDQFEDHVREMRRAELQSSELSKSSVDKAIGNTISALRALRSANHLNRYDPVGAELLDALKFDRAAELIYNLDITEKTAERHISELNKRVRPWAIVLQKSQIAHAKNLSEALQMLLDMHGYTIAELSRRTGIKRETLGTWVRGQTTPSTPSTVQSVGLIEREMGVAAHSLSKHCKVTKVYIPASRLKIDIDPADFKRMRPYVPDDFRFLSAEKQREICDWVMENLILSPSDDDDDIVANREPYRCKLRKAWLHKDTPGTFKAPEHLRDQVDGLVEFKSADLTPIGKKRDPEGRWTSEQSVDAKLITLEIFFGAMRKSKIADADLSLENFLDVYKIEAFIRYMRDRRGMYTETITLVLMNIASHLHAEHGYVPQHKVEILGPDTEVTDEEWAEKCQKACSFCWERLHQLEPLVQQGRNPFLPIEVILDDENPRQAYYAIADEIRSRTPSAAANEHQRARCFRELIMFRYAFYFPLRAGNYADLNVVPPGEPKTSMNKLRRNRSLELWWNEKEQVWVHRIPKESFKNWRSPATEDTEIVLPDEDGFYDEIAEYLRLRPLLINGHEKDDAGRLFPSDMTKAGSKKTYLAQIGFTQLWKNMIRKYGIYNPYTGTGAIAGLRVHPPHAARHIMATHILVTTGNVAWAAAAIFDTYDVTKKRYARFIPSQQYDRAMRQVLTSPLERSV